MKKITMLLLIIILPFFAGCSNSSECPVVFKSKINFNIKYYKVEDTKYFLGNYYIFFEDKIGESFSNNVKSDDIIYQFDLDGTMLMYEYSSSFSYSKKVNGNEDFIFVESSSSLSVYFTESYAKSLGFTEG